MSALNTAADQFHDMLATHVERTESPDWYGYFVKAYPEVDAHIDQINEALEKTYGDAVSIGVVYLDDAEPDATKASLSLMLFADGITAIDIWEISEKRVSTGVYANNGGAFIHYWRGAGGYTVLKDRKLFLAKMNQRVIDHIVEAGLKPLA